MNVTISARHKLGPFDALKNGFKCLGYSNKLNVGNTAIFHMVEKYKNIDSLGNHANERTSKTWNQDETEPKYKKGRKTRYYPLHTRVQN